jgi:hypothetical protein
MMKKSLLGFLVDGKGYVVIRLLVASIRGDVA